MELKSKKVMDGNNMKIVNNAFSTKMLSEECDIHFSIISEEEFMEALNDPVTKIVIGHEDTATYFDCEFHRETIHLKQGDTLFICELNNKAGERLPAGTQFIEQIGDGFYFRFCKMEIR